MCHLDVILANPQGREGHDAALRKPNVKNEAESCVDRKKKLVL